MEIEYGAHGGYRAYGGYGAPEVPVLDVLAWVELRDERMLTVRTRGRDAFYLPGRQA